MFEDHIKDNPMPAGTGQAPSNLPIGEPEDIFSRSDAAMPSDQPQMSTQEETVAAQPLLSTVSPSGAKTALDAGVLQPKQPLQEQPVLSTQPAAMPPVNTSQPHMTTPPVNLTQDNMDIPTIPQGGGYSVKEPHTSRIVFTILVSLIGIAIIGAIGYVVYAKVFADKQVQEAPIENIPLEEGTQNEVDPLEDEGGFLDVATSSDLEGTTSTSDQLSTSSENVIEIDPEDRVLFGNVDPDEDGLDDLRENDYGTDPLVWDTDEDGLSDGDEVNRWKTDPLNPDSDGDGYKDGDEVKNGYSPLGKHKLPEPPPPPEAEEEMMMHASSSDRTATSSEPMMDEEQDISTSTKAG